MNAAHSQKYIRLAFNMETQSQHNHHVSAAWRKFLGCNPNGMNGPPGGSFAVAESREPPADTELAERKRPPGGSFSITERLVQDVGECARLVVAVYGGDPFQIGRRGTTGLQLSADESGRIIHE